MLQFNLLLYFLSLKRIFPNHSCLTFQPFNLASCIWNQNTKNNNKKTKIQLKNDANMKTLATRNITKIDKHKKMEQHFFNGTQNRHEHY